VHKDYAWLGNQTEIDKNANKFYRGQVVQSGRTRCRPTAPTQSTPWARRSPIARMTSESSLVFCNAPLCEESKPRLQGPRCARADDD